MHGIRCFRLSSISVLMALLAACASAPDLDVTEAWMTEVLDYEASLGPTHTDSIDNVLSITPSMRDTVVEKFGHLPRYMAARRLAMWLVDENGKGMKYDIEANLSPRESYLENRGNCLSFTLLLLQLAKEIGIELNVNEVDLPDFWSENEERDLVFYRHVNAIYEVDYRTQIFDLAIEQYGPGYPQRFISSRQATALLYSNIGVQQLHKQQTEAALHYLKLAVSVSPRNSDLWINLAAALKRSQHLERAEQAYLRAVALNDRDSIAASNLERLYRAQGKLAKADQFAKFAQRARRKNPYIHFRLAQTAFKNSDYKTARKSVRRAINLHNQDPQFYALRSMLKQVKGNYIGALKDLEKAHNMSKDTKQRGRYADQVNKVIAQVKKQAEERQRRRDQNASNGTEVDVQSPSLLCSGINC